MWLSEVALRKKVVTTFYKVDLTHFFLKIIQFNLFNLNNVKINNFVLY